MVSYILYVQTVRDNYWQLTISFTHTGLPRTAVVATAANAFTLRQKQGGYDALVSGGRGSHEHIGGEGQVRDSLVLLYSKVW